MPGWEPWEWAPEPIEKSFLEIFANKAWPVEVVSAKENKEVEDASLRLAREMLALEEAAKQIPELSFIRVRACRFVDKPTSARQYELLFLPHECPSGGIGRRASFRS